MDEAEVTGEYRGGQKTRYMFRAGFKLEQNGTKRSE